MATTKRLDFQTALTDEMIEQAKSFEGMELRVEQWNYEATLDTIRHYVWGVGDNNPLYCDEQYGKNGPYGDVIAPPSFLYSIWSAAMGIGFTGLQPIYGGTKWVYNDVVRRGDRFQAEGRVGPLKVLTGRTASRFVMQTALCDYVRSDGKVVARSEGRTFRIPRGEAEGGLSYEPRPAHTYTAEELEDIRLQAISEPRRGSEPRFWEDVEVGEVVPPVVKGPIELMTMTAYYAGLPGSPATKSCEMSWLYRTWARESPEKLPNNYDYNFYSESVAPSLGHQEADVAHQIGMPGAYNNGAQKTAWMAHGLLNWMSDYGFLAEIESRLRRPDIFGDTVWCRATVSGKPEPGVVELELSTDNQFGDVTATGRAVVRLPQRDGTPAHENVPVPVGS